MREYFSLFCSIIVIVTTQWLLARRRYQKDWCGVKMILPTIWETMPTLIITSVFYSEFVSLISAILPNQGQQVLVFSLFGVSLDALIRLFFRMVGVQPQGYNPSMLAVINRTKKGIAENLVQDPTSVMTLTSAIHLSRLRKIDKNRLRERLGGHASQDVIYEVVNSVGVLVMKEAIRKKRKK